MNNITSMEHKIWASLKSSGMSDAGAAGVIGNLYAESGLNPRNLQNTFERTLGMNDTDYTSAVDSGSYRNFERDGAGYGIVQWTYHARKAGLLALCRNRGTSVGDLDTQLAYLMQELQTGYAALLTNLCREDISVREASDSVLLEFERPQKQDKSVRDIRYGYSMNYYNRYAGRTKGSDVMKIEDCLTTENYRAANRTPEYIVIHYFGGLGTAKNVAEYFKRPGVQASAHYIVDEGETIYRCVRDKDIAWHCGAKSYRHPLCRNANSIGIEARPKKLDASRIVAADTDWYFDPRVIDNVVWLTRRLMKQYGIQADRVLRHYDVTGKLCPRPMCGSDINQYYGESGDRQWEKFKQRIAEEEEEDMTLDQFKALMKEYRAELQDNDSGSWSAEARNWAIKNGLITGTGTVIDGEPNYAWADQLTREQAVTLFYRFARLIGKA